jgi:hypothetical protein
MTKRHLEVAQPLTGALRGGLCTAVHFYQQFELPTTFYRLIAKAFSSDKGPSLPRIRTMVGPHTDEKASMCCSTCNCLGFCSAKRANGTHSKPGLKILTNRSFNDFEISATEGCHFCDVTYQSFPLLRSLGSDLQVELLMYPQSPTEIHNRSNGGAYDVVEIYPCSSKHFPLLKCIV